MAKHLPERLQIAALTASTSVEALSAQIRIFKPEIVAVSGENERKKLIGLLDGFPLPQIEIGEDGLSLAATKSSAGAVLSAIVGSAGLLPTWAAAKAGLKVALANKESLVLAGEILAPLLGDRLSPVDSEHSAIFQALGGRLDGSKDVRRLILTASGGPFRGWSKERLSGATPEMALNHPTWSMGPKISCDSATMMNKGLEVIEAHHLFGLSYDDIDVIVQPGSAIHSLVEFEDASLLAQLGPADMRLAIAYALSHPDRWPLLRVRDRPGSLEMPDSLQIDSKIEDFSGYRPFELKDPIAFEEPNREAFPCLALAEAAGRQGGTAPAILNGANEAAVAAFLSGKISFPQIAEMVSWCLNHMAGRHLVGVLDALAADAEARALVEARVRASK